MEKCPKCGSKDVERVGGDPDKLSCHWCGLVNKMKNLPKRDWKALCPICGGEVPLSALDFEEYGQEHRITFSHCGHEIRIRVIPYKEDAP